MSTLRRLGPWLLLLLATAALAALLSTPRSGEPFGPVNPGVDGGQALAEVLREQGVDVEVVPGTAALDRGGAGTTVLLPHTAYLGPESGPALLQRLVGADRVVVLVPDDGQTPGEALGVDLDVSFGTAGAVSPDCPATFAREGDRLSRYDVLLSVGGADREGALACYPPGEGHNAGGAREGAVLTLPATAQRPELVVAGVTSAWTNGHVTEEANAALALRLLGGSDRLLWVLPQPGDAQLDAATTLWEVLPPFLTAWTWLLGAAVLALALWRGRRLGPVVTEPLPAVVHAAETTRSRGRLYRQARDRRHALAALQAGARRRLAPRLGLPRTTSPESLAPAVATATGRPEAEVRRLLLDDTAGDDRALVESARALRSLEEQVRG